MAANRISPQPQPRDLYQPARRSRAQSARPVRMTISGPTGPFTRVAPEPPSQNSSRVSRPAGGPSRAAEYSRAIAARASVVVPHNTASVLAMNASVESRNEAPRIAPDIRLAGRL